MTVARQFGKNKIIYGAMASGKSIEMIRHLHIYNKFARKFDYDVMVFKPAIDTRKLSVSQTFLSLSSRLAGVEFNKHIMAVASSRDILSLIKNNARHVIAIDEVQLFDSQIIEVISNLKSVNNHVIVSGVDKNFRGDPFPLADFKATMDDVIDVFDPEGRIHLKAVCEICGDEAEFSQRLLNGKPAPYFDPLIVIGDKHAESGSEIRSYEPRCKHHFVIPFKQEFHLVKFLLSQGKSEQEIKRIVPPAEQIIARIRAETSSQTLL